MKSNSVGSLIHAVIIAVLVSHPALNRAFFHEVMTPEAVCAGGSGLLTDDDADCQLFDSRRQGQFITTALVEKHRYSGNVRVYD